MNVTELARILKITPQELRDSLPQLGFDIGQKAIKINYNVAQKIIREWPHLKKKFDALKLEEKKDTEKSQAVQVTKKTIAIPDFITVRELARISGMPVNSILSELMKNGIFTSLNEKIDFETAWLIGAELGLVVEKIKDKDGLQNKDIKGKGLLADILAKEKKDCLQPRAPVVVVMGHVDHGKTKLLDAIRRTNVAEGEAGGITQHIGAYQAERKGKPITFIDTPGHEAFTAMRSRGAKIADIAILVVAADDGVKPQTIEAYRIIKAAKIPFLVAINKIDKPESNIDKTKQELSSQLNIVPEDWGGKIPCVMISAKKEQGVEDLLDTILLLAELEAKNIAANPNASASGTIIESDIDKGAGPVATILIQNGTLYVGDQLILNNQFFGKVRALKDYHGNSISQATPSMPVKIIGIKSLPEVGDILIVGEGERVRIKKIKRVGRVTTAQPALSEDEETSIKKVNLIIKSDVLGSAEAIEESLEKINTNKVMANIIHKGLGNITEGDIKRAEASEGTIIGFNIKVPTTIEELAREKNITIKTYTVIYDLLKNIKKLMQEIIEPEIKRVELGKATVLVIFRTEKNSQIIGAKVIEGKVETDSLIEVIRSKEIIATGKINNLQTGKQNVTACEINEECGIMYEGQPVIEKGDMLRFYKEEEVISKI